MLAQIMKRQLSEILDPNQFVRFWDAVDKINAALDESADLAGPVLEFVRLQHAEQSIRNTTRMVTVVRTRELLPVRMQAKKAKK